MRTTFARLPGMGWRRVLGAVAAVCVAAAAMAAPVAQDGASHAYPI